MPRKPDRSHETQDESQAEAGSRQENTRTKVRKSAKGIVRKTAPRRASPARARRAPEAPAKTDVIGTLVSANAQALGIPLSPASMGGVTFNLGLILRLAGMVDEFPLPDDIEPGPVFHA